MSTIEKSKNSDKAIDRPFETAIWQEAVALSGQYHREVWQDDEGWWWAQPFELPGGMGDGETPDQAIAQSIEAAAGCIATLLEEGHMPPPAIREAKRTEQVNVRLTLWEKRKLQTLAAQEGFKGLGDLLRTRALHEQAIIRGITKHTHNR